MALPGRSKEDVIACWRCRVSCGGFEGGIQACLTPEGMGRADAVLSFVGMILERWRPNCDAQLLPHIGL